MDPTADDLRALGKRIFKARLEMGASLGRPVTQEEVGEAMGVTSAAVSSWEMGQAWPRLDKLRRLAVVLGVREGWLVLNEGPMHYGDPEPDEGGKNGGHLKRA